MKRRTVRNARQPIGCSDGWLLVNHGSVVPDQTMLNAFYAQEESAHIAREFFSAGRQEIARRV